MGKLREIDYETAVQLMAFAGRTDVRIMEAIEESVDWHTLYELANMGRLMFFVPEEAQAQPEAEPEETATEQPDETQPEENQNKKIDIGRVKALYNAGWTAHKIADDMGIGLSRVYYYINKLREKGEI